MMLFDIGDHEREVIYDWFPYTDIFAPEWTTIDFAADSDFTETIIALDASVAVDSTVILSVTISNIAPSSATGFYYFLTSEPPGKTVLSHHMVFSKSSERFMTGFAVTMKVTSEKQVYVYCHKSCCPIDPLDVSDIRIIGY